MAVREQRATSAQIEPETLPLNFDEAENEADATWGLRARNEWNPPPAVTCRPPKRGSQYFVHFGKKTGGERLIYLAIQRAE
jgi:hypothetical protein